MKVLVESIKVKTVLLVAVLSIFVGRAWQFLFWDAPYRTLFWDEQLLKPLIEGVFNTSWNEYVTSTITDNIVNSLIFGSGVLFVLSAISCWVYYKNKHIVAKYILFLGGSNLVFLSFLLMKEKYFQFGQFFEHSIQFLLPFVFLYYLKDTTRKIQFLLKLLIAIVFVSHGLYAVGYYPVPGNFVDMVLRIFPVSEEYARLFLKFAGVLDFVVAMALFVPKLTRMALIYAMFWGLLTAFARIVANFQSDFFMQTIHQELYGTLYRLSHGLVPLLVILLDRRTNENWR